MLLAFRLGGGGERAGEGLLSTADLESGCRMLSLSYPSDVCAEREREWVQLKCIEGEVVGVESNRN